MKEGYILSDDEVKLFYQLIERGSDAIIVPLGCWLADCLKYISSESTLVFYDPRNRGKSEQVKDTRKIGMDFEISDLANVQSFFGFEEVSLIGWSYFGGMIVLYASKYPERVKKLIQLCPLSPQYDPYWEQYQATYNSRVDPEQVKKLEQMKEKGIDETNPAEYTFFWYHNVFCKAAGENVSKVNKEYLRNACSLENESVKNLNYAAGPVFEKLGKWDWSVESSSVEKPTLTIHGENDNIPLEGSKKWKELLPHAKLEIIKDVGHTPFLTEPEKTLKLIENFLNE